MRCGTKTEPLVLFRLFRVPYHDEESLSLSLSLSLLFYLHGLILTRVIKFNAANWNEVIFRFVGSFLSFERRGNVITGSRAANNFLMVLKYNRDFWIAPFSF